MAYAIVGEVSSTRLRSKSVGLARNLYNVTRIIAGLLYTYQVNPTGWNWKGKAAFFWVSLPYEYQSPWRHIVASVRNRTCARPVEYCAERSARVGAASWLLPGLTSESRNAGDDPSENWTFCLRGRCRRATSRIPRLRKMTTTETEAAA